MSQGRQTEARGSVISMDATATSIIQQTQDETVQIQKIKKIIHAFPLEKYHEDYDRHLIQ
jgi:hypothetical protein